MRQLRSVHLGFELGLVDPELGGHERRVRPTAEPLGVGVVGGGEGVLPVLIDRARRAVDGLSNGIPDSVWFMRVSVRRSDPA